ncbi:MAG TPA: helix-turn-helix domain-containing protein [Actinomycetota bacterium]|jgi:predicted ArsR family transcriptional regulator
MASTTTPKTLEIHKALADDTRYRLYRYVGLARRPVSVQEIARRLSLHPNTIRPHLRRLEEAGLISRETARTSSVGRPQTLYAIRETVDEESRDYRLLADMLCGLVRGPRQLERAQEIAREWGAYLVAQGRPRPGARSPTGSNLALLQDAMARAGFDPRFRRRGANDVDVSLRACPFRDLAEEYRELTCTLHRGLIEGIVAGLQPPLAIREFEPFAERGICRVRAG